MQVNTVSVAIVVKGGCCLGIHGSPTTKVGSTEYEGGSPEHGGTPEYGECRGMAVWGTAGVRGTLIEIHCLIEREI